MVTQRWLPTAPGVQLFVAGIDGPPSAALLVVHGGPDWDHSYLVDPLARLGGRCQVVLPDLRGCGRSTVGLREDQYNPDAAIGDLLMVLDRLHLKQVAVLGFSYGGLLAQRLTVAAPERVRRLIVASSSVLPAEMGSFDTVPGRSSRIAAEAAATLPSARLERPIEQLAATAVPVLLLHGAYDMTFPAELAHRAAELLPNAAAVVLDDAAHMAHIDQPDQWIAAVTEFLDITDQR